MVVNTVNELISLLNQVDEDATVLAAIANDAPTATGSGSGPGLVTTRLGTNVKNVRKVIADIENGITEAVRPALQEEGITVLDNPGTINFVGAQVTVTDVSGVATVTIADPEVTKVGTPADNQVGIWTGDGTIEGATGLEFDGTELGLSAVAGPTFAIDETTNSVTYVSKIINPGTPVAIIGTETNHALRIQTNNIPKVAITPTGLVGIGLNNPSEILTLNADSATIRFQDVSSSNFSEISNGDSILDISVDVDDTISSSAITFTVDGSEMVRIDDAGNIDLTNDGYVTATTQVDSQTGTAYTLPLSSTNGIVTMDNAAANTLTIDPVATTAYPLGYTVEVIQLGAGTTTIQAGTGVELNGVTAGGGDITAQYDVVKLRHVASDVWIVSGDIGAIA